jgi:hypothetical protein
MTGQGTIAGAGPDRLSPWWWLALPLAVAVALSLTWQWARSFYVVWIGSETSGLLELSHLLLPLASGVLAVRILFMRRIRGRPLLLAWVAGAALASFYIAGEEASWGQHYFRWATPEAWMAVNDQGETNLHNTSSWFDQKPRLLLELGVVVGGILVPLLALRRPAIRRGRLGVILPPLLCLPSALLAEVVRLSDRLAALLGDKPYLLTRPSEIQELYFYLFILFYLIVLRRRLAAAPA